MLSEVKQHRYVACDIVSSDYVRLFEMQDWLVNNCTGSCVWHVTAVEVTPGEPTKDRVRIFFRNPKHKVLFELAWSEYVVK